MAERKFKIGDRVRVIKKTGDHHAKMGMTGTVICFDGYLDGVRFDEKFNYGHSLLGRCESGYGQWMEDTDIELIDGHKDDHKIVITTDGKNTLAMLYENGKVIKTAEAKCSPDDTFDFETGAKLAFERLTAKPKHDYTKALNILEKYCVGVPCSKCILKKYAESKGKKYCYDIADFSDIEDGKYSPEYLDNLIADLNKFEADVKEKEKVDKFIPHLESEGEHYGQIGKETKYVDAVGRKLCIGDVVEHFNDNGTSFGDTVIVEQALCYRNDKVKQFVMGIESCCNDENGSIGEGWKIIKKRSFDDVKNGEEIGFIKFIKQETF